MEYTSEELKEILNGMGVKTSFFKKRELEEMLKKVEPIRLDFAKYALTGLVSNPTYFNTNEHHKMIREDLIFKRAFSMADGMIKESGILKSN